MTEETAFRARSRAQSLLLRAAGTPLQALAEASQVHRVTVSAWIKPWAPHGAQSLPDPPRSGRPRPRTPDDQARAHHSSTAAPRALQTVVARCAHPTAKRLSLSTRQRLATTARRMRTEMLRGVHLALAAVCGGDPGRWRSRGRDRGGLYRLLTSGTRGLMEETCKRFRIARALARWWERGGWCVPSSLGFAGPDPMQYEKYP